MWHHRFVARSRATLVSNQVVLSTLLNHQFYTDKEMSIMETQTQLPPKRKSGVRDHQPYLAKENKSMLAEFETSATHL